MNEISQLENKIKELVNFSEEYNLDLTSEISKLNEKLSNLKTKFEIENHNWNKIALARNIERPTTLDYIQNIFTDFIELHGDRQFSDDTAIVGGIGLLNNMPVTIIGHQKGKNTKENIYRRFGMPQPEGYRKALRLMQQANKFNRPIITFINTAGAFPGKEAEERGQSEAIARNLFEMSQFHVPIISIVIGEGGSGGALALGVANKIFMLENSFYSVISPEGAASLLWKDVSKAKFAADSLKITADDLLSLNIIDGIVLEPNGGSHLDCAMQSDFIKTTLLTSLNELSQLSKEELIAHRFDKFRSIGVFQDN